MRKYYMLLLIIYYFVFVSVQETMLNLKKSIIMDTKKFMFLNALLPNFKSAPKNWLNGLRIAIRLNSSRRKHRLMINFKDLLS